ncbi:MAG: DUF5916 domain-containing protein [Saprospiraceae bacterium]
MRYFLFVLISISCLGSALSTSNPPNRSIKAYRTTDEIKVDGVLSEEVWAASPAATGFTQTEPHPGQKATHETEVFFVYDNNAIYIAARMYDPEPEKILRELSLRDQIGNADNFRIFLDTYKSGLNGFMFYVTASGVQFEAVVTNNRDDSNWNAVWESAVSMDDTGWYAEIKIPYSSLRFPSSEVQEWNIQFGREIRRYRETSYWSPIDPVINGWVQQSGTVTDLQNIKSPIRLSLTPYLSGYVNTTYQPGQNDGSFTTGTAYSAGLDLKYGLNDAFTLDMTLVPDFGQVISDKQVLNLSPFEVFFEDNRQFFTEGTELFERGRLFYSRRVGGRPLNYGRAYEGLKSGESVISNPDVSQLYNATKISGRLASGTGIGGFNAIVGESFATIMGEDGAKRTVLTNPFTNYNALVIDQNLKNNSFVSMINTNVHRFGEDYDANVTGGFFNFRTVDQKYFVGGSGVLSQKFFKESTSIGHTYNVALGKASGNWTYEFEHGVESDTYDPNDMGFLLSPNEKYFNIEGKYTQYKPKHPKIQQFSISSNSNYTRLYKPNVFTDFSINLESFVLFKSRFAFGIDGRVEPVETFDYFEPRTSDFSRYLTWPKNYRVGGFVSSDYRKKFAYDVRMSYRSFDADSRDNVTLSVSPRIRFNDRLSVFTGVSVSSIHAEPGYVNKNLAQKPIPGLNEMDILMGIRNRLIIENSLTGRYIFNNLMGVNVRIRHYWDKVIYQQFGSLSPEGYLDKLAYDGLNEKSEPIYDRNVNIFNVDLQYNWRFAPGSDVIFVWKNQIFNSDKNYERDYLANFGGLFDAIQTNNFSVRFLYFLDYLYVFPRKDS